MMCRPCRPCRGLLALNSPHQPSLAPPAVPRRCFRLDCSSRFTPSLTAALVCIQESEVSQQAAQAALEKLVVLRPGQGQGRQGKQGGQAGRGSVRLPALM